MHGPSIEVRTVTGLGQAAQDIVQQFGTELSKAVVICEQLIGLASVAAELCSQA